MEFSRKEYWSGLLFPSPGDLPSPHIKPGLPKLQADSFLSEPPGKPLQNNIPLPKNLQNFYCSYLLHTHQHPSIPPFILSIFLSTYYAVETALGTGDTAVRKIIQILCPHGAYISADGCRSSWLPHSWPPGLPFLHPSYTASWLRAWRDRLVPLSGTLFPLVFVALMYLSDINLKGTTVGKSSLIPPTRPQMKLPFDVL